MKASISAATTRGRKLVNQDRYLVDATIKSFDTDVMQFQLNVQLDDKIHIAAIADGVSNSSAAGECADDIITYLAAQYKSGYFQEPLTKRHFDSLMSKIVDVLNVKFESFVGLQSSSTISIVAFNHARLWTYNLGDSPIYINRNDTLFPLYEEHVSPNNYITRYVGNNVREIDGSFFEYDFIAPDTIILASDGLFKSVSTDEIIRNDSAFDIIKCARPRYPADDVTIIVIKKEA